MTTLTIDVLNDKAINLLKDLELLKIIRVRNHKELSNHHSKDLIAKYKGSITKQSVSEVDQQLDDIRSEWE